MQYLIQITHSVPTLPALSGAAQRAAMAANAAAEDFLARLRAAAARLEFILATPPERVDATTLSAGFENLAEWEAAKEAKGILAPRHRSGITIDEFAQWPIDPVGYAVDPGAAIQRAARKYQQILADAGVPMPEAGVLTAEYWRDAAARGC